MIFLHLLILAEGFKYCRVVLFIVFAPAFSSLRIKWHFCINGVYAESPIALWGAAGEPKLSHPSTHPRWGARCLNYTVFTQTCKYTKQSAKYWKYTNRWTTFYYVRDRQALQFHKKNYENTVEFLWHCHFMINNDMK